MSKKETRTSLRATHQGELPILGISCAVLDNRERIISIRSFANALGTKGGGAYWKEKKDNPNKELLPEFISAKVLEEYIDDELRDLVNNTFTYKALNGQEAQGIKGEIIPKICDVWLKALSAGKLTEKQRKVAEKAHILLSALANVGITALIDEATGFQKLKDEYNQIIERYIAKELQPWIKTFGEDFYFHIYRLKGWDWNRYTIDKKNHPWAVANITNRIIYEKLPIGILEKLNEINPPDKKGRRKSKQFQNLTPNDGYVHLLKHLGAIVMIFENYDNGEWEKALHAIDTRFPSARDPYQLSMDNIFANKHIFDESVIKAAGFSALKSGQK